MRCIMLFYNDLSDSPAGDMSSLFGVVNFICPFCILLCIYTFYYVLPLDNIGYCILLLTWRFRLLWWCFLLSIWQCKVLYPIVQFYILLCTKICYHPRLGNWEFFILFCVPVLRSVWFCEVVLCLCHILHGTQWTKIKWPSRGMGIVLSQAAISCHPLSKMADNVACHVAARNHLRNVLFDILRQLKLGNGDSDTLDHVQYRLDCLYRIILRSQVFWCWNCWWKSSYRCRRGSGLLRVEWHS